MIDLRSDSAIKCFFDGTHGLGDCVGEVKEGEGLADFVFTGPTISDRGYCTRHRYGNLDRARWESKRGFTRQAREEQAA